MLLMRWLIAVFTVCALLLPAGAAAAEYDVQAPGRVVAFGDVHGAYEDWTALLQEVGVADADLNWVGGNAHLVSVGALIDRGPGSRKVVELMMKLEQQAAAAGGAVHLILGNHEVMVLTGDLRYVSAAEFAEFSADETAADREAAFADYRRFNSGGDDADVRAAFDTQYPPGYFALRKAYASDGPLGSWLIDKPYAIKVNDKVFLHAGIAYELSDKTLRQLNKELQTELQDYLKNIDDLRDAGVMPWHVSYDDRLRFLNAAAEKFALANPRKRADWFAPLTAVFEAQEAVVFSDDSPIWYRGTALCHPYTESFNTERFLKKVGAEQLVVGHTPTRGDVHSRMGGSAIRLDTGMLKSVYKGRAAALIYGDGQEYIHYLGNGERAQPTPEVRELAMQLSQMSDADLEEFMRTAEVVSVKDIGTGITKPKRVRQSANGMTNDSVFKYEDSHPGIESRERYIPRRNDDADRYVYDVAAYKIDRMIDLQMVPTATLAQVEGQDGALSDWVENAINERDRVASDMPFNSFCKQHEQYRLRYIFDILIHNDDRNLTNILWTKDDYMLRFIDHSLAFRAKDDRPKQYRKVILQVSDLLRGKLEALDEEMLTAELSEYLHPKQIQAILERRDLILKQAKRPEDR